MWKLEFHPIIVKIILSFLKNRSFTVKCNGEESTTRPIPAGTPQGSVLSAVLFSLFINDLPNSNQVKVIQYADDTLVYHTARSAEHSQIMLTRYLNALSKHLTDWKIKLNPEKSSVMSIVGQCVDTSDKLRAATKRINISMNNIRINVVPQMKYLGVTLTRNFRFHRHVEAAIEKTEKAKLAINRVLKSRLIDTPVKTMFYTAYLRPILTYGSQAWFVRRLVSSALIERIRVCERKILRNATNIYRNKDKHYIKSSVIYKTANVPRVDLFMLKQSLNFSEKIKDAEMAFIKRINEFYDTGSKRYKNHYDWQLLAEKQVLMHNGNFFHFNQKYKHDLDSDDIDDLVYITAQ